MNFSKLSASSRLFFMSVLSLSLFSYSFSISYSRNALFYFGFSKRYYSF